MGADVATAGSGRGSPPQPTNNVGILVNDVTKTDGKRCKRGPDGKVPEIGNSCLGGTGCKNACLLSTSFGAYGVAASGP